MSILRVLFSDHSVTVSSQFQCRNGRFFQQQHSSLYLYIYSNKLAKNLRPREIEHVIPPHFSYADHVIHQCQ